MYTWLQPRWGVCREHYNTHITCHGLMSVSCRLYGSNVYAHLEILIVCVTLPLTEPTETRLGYVYWDNLLIRSSRVNLQWCAVIGDSCHTLCAVVFRLLGQLMDKRHCYWRAQLQCHYTTYMYIQGDTRQTDESIIGQLGQVCTIFWTSGFPDEDSVNTGELTAKVCAT